MKKPIQPNPKKGSIFTAWAVYNWGHCLGVCFRTRKDAKEYCIDHNANKAKTWDDVKSYMKVVKVNCVVL